MSSVARKSDRILNMNENNMDIKDWLPEFSVSAEDDKDLMSYFFESEYVKNITVNNKWLVLGRKGSGKTAIYQYYNSQRFNKDKNIVVPLNFRDYPWPIHRLYKEAMEGEINAYYKSWFYVIITQSLIKLIQKAEQQSNLTAELKEAKKLITQIYNKPTPTLIETIKNKVAALKEFSLPSMEFDDISASLGSVSFEDISKDKEMIARLKSNVFQLSDYFLKILNNNSAKYNVYITIDHLDENWLPDEIPEYSKILINLLNVCKNINNETKIKNLKLIIFLRLDIFESLNFNDKNKLFQSNSIEIKWDLENLNDMFYERIKKNKPNNVIIEESKKANSIFEVEYVRHGATPLKHILRRSFYRPRDIIVYFNKIRQAHQSFKPGLYTSNDLYKAEKDYSISLHNELIDEWINQKPEIRIYLNVLQNIGIQKFKYDEFSKKYIEEDENASKTDIENSLEFLFKNSIIGQKVQANWEFYCTNPFMIIDHKKEFFINNGLKNRLNIQEKRKVSDT